MTPPPTALTPSVTAAELDARIICLEKAVAELLQQARAASDWCALQGPRPVRGPRRRQTIYDEHVERTMPLFGGAGMGSSACLYSALVSSEPEGMGDSATRPELDPDSMDRADVDRFENLDADRTEDLTEDPEEDKDHDDDEEDDYEEEKSPDEAQDTREDQSEGTKDLTEEDQAEGRPGPGGEPGPGPNFLESSFRNPAARGQVPAADDHDHDNDHEDHK